jgi:hypothetical protein
VSAAKRYYVDSYAESFSYGPYGWRDKWRVMRRAKGGGDRIVAEGLSRGNAGLIVKALNAFAVSTGEDQP